LIYVDTEGVRLGIFVRVSIRVRVRVCARNAVLVRVSLDTCYLGIAAERWMDKWI
jgi:hypothetical protein